MRVKGGLADGAHHLARRHQRGRPRQHRRCTCSAYPTCHFVTEGSYARVNEVCNKLFFRHVPVPDTIHMEERWGTNIVVAVAPNDTRILHIADPLGYVHIVVTRGGMGARVSGQRRGARGGETTRFMRPHRTTNISVEHI